MRLAPVFQAELYLAHGDGQGSNRTEGPRPIIEKIVRLSKVRMIQHVKELGAKFEFLFSDQIEFLSNGTIEDRLARARQNVAAGISEGEVRRESKGIDVEPQF